MIVEEGGEPERFSRSIVVNGKSDGNLAWNQARRDRDDYPTMAISGLLPALIADRHERAFVIGWGTGVTAGELAALAQTQRVEVAEISRGVIASAPLFDAANLGASRSPKVSIAQGDAYRLLAQSGERYDVIVSEPSNPWVVGVEMLYSFEFLRRRASGSRRAASTRSGWPSTRWTTRPSSSCCARSRACSRP